MLHSILFRGLFFAALILFLTGCSKDARDGSSRNLSGPAGWDNSNTPPVEVDIIPYSVEAPLSADLIDLEAQAYYANRPGNPVLNQIEWKAVAGPSTIQILSPVNLSTQVTRSGYGVYVLQCKVRDQSGKSDSATSVISVHDPSRPDQSVVLPNQSWVETGKPRQLRVNLYQHIPAGTPLRKVFMKTDCSSSFMPVFNAHDNSHFSYAYWLEFVNNTVWLCVGNFNGWSDFCSLPQDTPDIRLVY